MAQRARISSRSDDYLLDCLRALQPEGASGFEGLVRLLMEAWTGRRFRLARGGEQFGHDAMADPGPLAPTILVECKKYDKKNKPPSREVVGEIGQAVTRFPTLDLYVLVATTEFGSNSLDEAFRLAHQHAVEVLVVDTRPDGVDDVHLLCAEFPQVTADFLVAQLSVDGDKLARILDGIRSGGDFAGRVEGFRAKLSGMLLGFDDARRRMAEWLRQHVVERAEAMVAFGQDLALLGPDIELIPRRQIFFQLGAWRGADPTWPFALIGEEGSGKSWAAMAWLLTLIERPDHPLIIPVTSNVVTTYKVRDPLLIMAQVLYRCIGHAWGMRSEHWWEQRVRLWCQQIGEQDVPPVLILLDGLNEAPDASWRTVINATQARPVHGFISVLTTCRNAFWEEMRSGHHSPLVRHFTEGYDNDELRQAVRGRIDLLKVPEDLRDLMRRPRYCDLVIRHFAAMIDSGDFTISRLLFEDRRDRYSRKENHPFTPKEFDQVLASLARAHRGEWQAGRGEASFDKARLRQLLPRDDVRALQELLDGGVLIDGGDPAAPYRVEARRLVYGLGMLLASDLRRNTDRLADAVEEWFEPQRDMDIKTEILGAAVFFSLPTCFPSYPAPQRRALLRAWLISRNMPAEQDAAIAAYLPDCAEDLLAESDGFFGPGETANGNGSERLGRALAARRLDPRVLPALRIAARRWAGYVRGAKDGSAWEAPSTRLGPFQWVAIEDLRGSGLQVFFASIIQAGPREPFIEAYVRNALAAGFIQQQFVDARALWSLRLTDEDMEDLLLPSLPEMAEAGGVGHLLLRNVLGTRRARDDAEYRRFGADAGNGDTDSPVLDPAVSLGREWEAAIRDRLGRLPISEHIAGLYSTSTDHEFAELEPTAAALAPDALGQFLRSVLASLPERDPENLLTICLSLPQMIAVAGPMEFAAISSVQHMLASRVGSDALSAEAYAFVALAMGLPAMDALEILLTRPADAFDLQELHHWFRPQSDDVAATIHARLLEETDPRRLFRLLSVAACAPRPPTPAQRQVIARCIVADDDDLRYGATLYALAAKDANLIAEVVRDQRAFLGETGHLADCLQAHLLAHHGQHVPFAEIARRLTLPDLASAVLARGSLPAEVDDLSARVDTALHDLGRRSAASPDSDGAAVIAHFSYLCEVKVAFFSEVRAERSVQVETAEDCAQFGRVLSGEDVDGDTDADALKERFFAFRADGPLRSDDFPAAAIRAMHDRRPSLVIGWADAAIGQSLEAKRLRFSGSAFFQSLAAALVRDDPDRGFRLWRTLRAEGVSTRFAVNEAATDWMTCLPFQAPDTPESLAVRREMLDQAITDEEFLEVATAAAASGCRNWLIGYIREHLAMRPLWRRGKGVALAALADLDDSTYELLVAEADVFGTWVGDVLPALLCIHNRNRWARHWYRQYLTAYGKDESYAGFVLFLRCVDRRCRLWMDAMEQEAAGQPEFDDGRVRYRETNDQAIAKAIDENEKPFGNALMGLDFKKVEVIPYGLWLSPDIHIPGS